jgi:hypothetical protein
MSFKFHVDKSQEGDKKTFVHVRVTTKGERFELTVPFNDDEDAETAAHIILMTLRTLGGRQA